MFAFGSPPYIPRLKHVGFTAISITGLQEQNRVWQGVGDPFLNLDNEVSVPKLNCVLGKLYV